MGGKKDKGRTRRVNLEEEIMKERKGRKLEGRIAAVVARGESKQTAAAMKYGGGRTPFTFSYYEAASSAGIELAESERAREGVWRDRKPPALLPLMTASF